MNESYLAVLGSHPTLSTAELEKKSQILGIDEKLNVALLSHLHFENPRDIPKDPHQLWLDQCGGVIRIAKFCGQAKHHEDLAEIILKHLPETNNTLLLGLSGFGISQQNIKHISTEIETQYDGRVRFMRPHEGTVLSSGQMFGDKVMRKGAEFIIYRDAQDILVFRTVALQNLRNYELRDHRKPWRDAKMGMLPPKLAQILLNMAQPEADDLVIDPFCGSGTVCFEAAIAGFKSAGSDINPTFINGCQENQAFLSEKFRFPPEISFTANDATKIKTADFPNGVLVTEGFLGTNFEQKPSLSQAEEEARRVTQLWNQVLENLKGSGIKRMAFCIPNWQVKPGGLSIREKIFAKARECSYILLALFDGKSSYVYKREGAYVGREIVVLEKQPSP